MTPDADRNELVRHAVLSFLAPRLALRFDAPVIRQRVISIRRLDFEPGLDDIASALAFLASKGWVVSHPSELGRSRFYQATSAGVLAHERGALEPST